jgi:hypothetical protein
VVSEVSREEFAAFCDRMYASMDDGFKGVHGRLDVLNGRTLKGEIDRENLRTRLVTVERELIRHPNRRKSDAGDGATWAAAAVTKREGYLIGLGLTVLITVLKVLEVLGTKLVHVLMSTKT